MKKLILFSATPLNPLTTILSLILISLCMFILSSCTYEMDIPVPEYSKDDYSAYNPNVDVKLSMMEDSVMEKWDTGAGAEFISVEGAVEEVALPEETKTIRIDMPEEAVSPFDPSVIQTERSKIFMLTGILTKSEDEICTYTFTTKGDLNYVPEFDPEEIRLPVGEKITIGVIRLDESRTACTMGVPVKVLWREFVK